jgi:purine-binding chemotaxis protein CheW
MKTSQTIEKDLQIVGFRIGRETFGLPIAAVREIVRVPEITSVPNAPDFIEGVINLRGRIIPVVDLRKRFGEPVGPSNKKNRIVVVEVENRLLGLMVNSASEVLKIPPSEIEAPHSVFQEGDLNYITGVGKLHGRLVILLDLSKVLQRGELKRLEEAESPEIESDFSKSRAPVLSSK